MENKENNKLKDFTRECILEVKKGNNDEETVLKVLANLKIGEK